MVLIAFITVLGIGWGARYSILRDIAALWVIPSDPISRADAIVVLGGDGYKCRPSAAAELYDHGLASWILVPENQDDNRETLLRLGISPQVIAGYGSVSSTYDEAHAVASWALRSGIKSVTVITELFSSRRVRWIFDHELSTIGVVVHVLVLTSRDYSLDDWWLTQNGVLTLRNEVLKYLYYRVRYW